MSALGGRNCGAEVLISRWSERIGRKEQSRLPSRGQDNPF